MRVENLNLLILTIYIYSFAINIFTQALFNKQTNSFIALLLLALIGITKVQSNSSLLKIDFKKQIVFFIGACLFFSIIYQYIIYGLDKIALDFCKIIFYNYIIFCNLSIDIDYQKFLVVGCRIGKLLILCFIIYILFLSKSFYNTNYMSIGSMLTIPSLFFLFGYAEFKSKTLFTFELITIYLIFQFGNRGALIHFIVFMLNFIYIKIKKNSVLSLIYASIFFFFISIINFLKEDILYYFINTLNLKNRLLIKMYQSLKNTGSGFLSGREIEFQKALGLITENPALGSGVFGFYNKYNFMYSHFILYDILITFGFLGLILLFLFIYFFKRNHSFKMCLGDIKILYFCCLAQTGFIISNHFLITQWFWIITIILLTNYNKNKG